MSTEKEKYMISPDIIQVKTEPIQNNNYIKDAYLKNTIKSRISLNIDSILKTNLHMYCIKNKKNMTDVIEIIIKKFLENPLP